MASQLHNRIISYSQLSKELPTRTHFLNPVEYKQINDQLNNSVGEAEFLFLPTYLQEINLQDIKYKPAVYKIILIGIALDGRKINVIIDNIQPYFEVKIPLPSIDNKIIINTESTIKQYTVSEYIQNIQDILKMHDSTTPIKTTQIEAKSFKYYQKQKNIFVRFYYQKTKNRTEAIKLIRQHGYETAHDDLNSYYRVVCRDYLTTFSSWAVLTNWTYKSTMSCLKGETLRVDINDYNAYKEPLTNNLLKDKTMSMTWDIETWSKKGNLPNPDDPQDCIFCIGTTFQWVHEKQSFLRICLVDYPCEPHPDYLTIVCGNEINIIKAFGDIIAKLRPEFIMGFNDSSYDWPWLINRAVQTKDTLSYLAKQLDSNIPWRNYIDANVYKFNYKTEHIKVEADTYIDGHSLMMAGYIPLDVRTIFRKLYPTAEASSLKWFLEKNKLGGKEDMPYKLMFQIYKDFRNIYENPCVQFNINQNIPDPSGSSSTEQTTSQSIDLSLPNFRFDSNVSSDIIEKYQELKKQLTLINKYCVVDAQRCHELMRVRSVIMDHREASNTSYCSVYDAFYRANGMKVRNITIAYGQSKNLPFGIRFSNITNSSWEEGKYPGAYVFPPLKGLRITKLSIQERIAKAKLTKGTKRETMQEWLNTTDEELQKYYQIIDQYGPIIKDVNQLTQIEQQYGHLSTKFKEFLTEEIGRPMTGLDFSSLYPSLIRTYNFSPEYCILDKKEAKQLYFETNQRLTKVNFEFNGQRKIAYFIWHNNEIEPYLNNNEKNPNFQFGVYPYILNKLFYDRKKLKSQMNIYAKQIKEMEVKGEEYIKQNITIYDDLCFQMNYLNSKQLALKVFMNTFYGECGNKLSPFFVLEVAGGITTYGQKNIKKAQRFVEDHKCRVYYGDSVAGDTPILVRHPNWFNNQPFYIEIQNLINATEYQQVNYTNNIVKEIANLTNWQVWSDKEWTPIKSIIRHKIETPLYRVISINGMIDVTKDHSLLDQNGQPIKPKDLIRFKSQLLYYKHPEVNNIYPENSQTCRSAYIYNKYINIIKTNYITQVTPINRDGQPIQSTTLNTIINSIQNYTTPIYVYDLETENHHFAAGIGHLVVHNTDSLYISIPECHFANYDKLFYLNKISKLEYWTKLVEITIEKIKKINDDINQMFFEDNKTHFLKMAYEEVLFPVVLAAKKKYFGRPHEEIIDFNSNTLFIRGFEVKKRGVSGLLKRIFNDIMLQCMSIENLYTLLELVIIKIDEIYSTQWKLDDFIQTDVYRPNKQNVKIHTFVQRMKERGITVPTNERFEYVIVKQYPYKYDYRGRKITLGIGDKMEFIETVKQQNLEVDLDHYMKGSINGQLARLIVYHEKFHLEPRNDTLEELKITEDAIYKRACNYIDQYCQQYYSTYNTFGKVYKTIYKTANSLMKNYLQHTDPFIYQLMTANITGDDFTNWFINFVEKKASQQCKNYGNRYIENIITEIKQQEKNKNKSDIQKCISHRLETLQCSYYHPKYINLLKLRTHMAQEIITGLTRQIKENTQAFINIYTTYNNNLESLIEILKQHMNLSNTLLKATNQNKDYTIDDFNINLNNNDIQKQLKEKAGVYSKQIISNPKFITIFNKFKILYKELLAAFIMIKQTESTVDYLKLKQYHGTNIIQTPDTKIINNIIEMGIQELINNDQSTQIFEQMNTLF